MRTLENSKYLLFYALLLIVVVLGLLQLHWLIIFPAALILSGVYILIKGNRWRSVMGRSEMNAGVVFIATLLSQLVLAAILYGLGRGITYLIG